MKRAIESKYPLAVVRKFRKQGTWGGDEKIIAVTTELADSGNTLAASALARRFAKQRKFDSTPSTLDTKVSQPQHHPKFGIFLSLPDNYR